MQTSRQTTTVLLLILCVFFWGSVFPVAKIILSDMSNVSLAVLRFIISMVWADKPVAKLWDMVLRPV
jgi:drug/metabolite transporter (DMT)-like permease